MPFTPAMNIRGQSRTRRHLVHDLSDPYRTNEHRWSHRELTTVGTNLCTPAGQAPSSGEHRTRVVADAPVSQLEAVLADAQADAALLHRLAPALGLHTADLFVIAGRDLPADLAPASGTRPWHVGQVMLSAMRLHGERFDRLHEFIRCMPGRDPVAPLPLPRSPAGPGALVGGLLANRNIRPHIAKLLYTIGDGPIVSDSTVYRVIHGRSALTARYVTAFAACLIRVNFGLAGADRSPPVTAADSVARAPARLSLRTPAA